MKPRLAIALALIVIIPFGVLAWLGVAIAERERMRVERHARQLLDGRLDDIRRDVGRFMATRHRECMGLIEQCDGQRTDPLRGLIRQCPWARQIFVLAPDGRILHPPPEPARTDAERAFLERTRSIWASGQVFAKPGDGADRAEVTHGWYTWFWGRDLHFIFWQRRAGGFIVGVEVDRTVLMSELIARLPATEAAIDSDLPRVCFVLSDAQGDTIYQWGPYAGAEGEPPEVRRTLAAPLDAWSLAVYTPRERRGLADRGVAFNVLSGLVAIGLCLLGLAVYLYREGSRELREASQRASFVNQVSHELKTPLTNIRLYAELLESRLRDADVRTRDHARVVVSECQRLSRLVNNVLTFARSQKRRLSLRAQPGVVDEVVSAVIEGFRPALESKGIRIAVSGSCPARVLMDRDAIEQVLGNLFGNVEKYAADGRLLEVSTSALDDRTVITVADRGPGIPARYREKVFAPFFRLSDRLADGVTGTGIGLSIARTLARLHGGDLTLEPAECGARFRVELRTPPADGRHPEGTGDENPGG